MPQLIHTESGATFASEEMARRDYAYHTWAATTVCVSLDPNDPELLSTLLANGYAVYVPPPTPPPTEAEIAQQRQALVDAIASAAREYVEHRANAALQDELRDARAALNAALAANPTPEQLADINAKMAMLDAVRDWGKGVYNEAEVNKSMALAGVLTDYAVACNFTAHGDKPYTVYQLYVAGLVTL